jgi:2-methylcitrate dehydratase PrpD
MAASRLLGLNEAQTTHAISLVASRASGLKSQFGTMGKPYHAGMAASNGIEVALLAKAGFISRSSALDGEQGFAETHAGECNDAAFEGMGETFIFEDVQHKFHACCHGLHACLEALGRIIANGGAVPDQIEMMSVSTNSRFMRVCNIASPTTGLEAKFSFRLVMALAVLGYDTAALDTYTDEICSVPSVVGLRDMVVVNVDDTLAETESVVTVRDKSGVQKTVRYDLSDLLPLAEKQARIAAKSASLIGNAAAQRLWGNVMAEQTLPIL